MPYRKLEMIVVLPAEMPESERLRFDTLAKAFAARGTLTKWEYIFSPSWGEKCQLLFDGGFWHDPTPEFHKFSYPGGKKSLFQNEAVKMARALRAAKEAEAA